MGMFTVPNGVSYQTGELPDGMFPSLRPGQATALSDIIREGRHGTDIEEYGDKLATKEAVAIALEHLGRVRVVSILTGVEQAEERRRTWKNSPND